MNSRGLRTQSQPARWVPHPAPLPHLPHLVSLEEIDEWLERYREAVKSVEGGLVEHFSAVVGRLEEHRRRRRAELS